MRAIVKLDVYIRLDRGPRLRRRFSRAGRGGKEKKRPRHAATTCTRSNALAYPSVEERAAGPPVRAARTRTAAL